MKSTFFFLLLGLSLHAVAQKKPTTPAKVTVQKKPNTPPIPTTYTVNFGPYKKDTISVAMVKFLIDSALNITDNVGGRYQVVSFRLIYRYTTSFLDPKSMQRQETYDTRVQDFNNTDTFPDDWRVDIHNNVKKGDFILFNKIYYLGRDGKRVLAPDKRFYVL